MEIFRAFMSGAGMACLVYGILWGFKVRWVTSRSMLTSAVVLFLTSLLLWTFGPK